MSMGFFITGTDTGVGKTIVAAGLVLALKKMGINACPMKPVESGCEERDGVPYPSDGALLKSLAGLDEPVENISPLCLRAPLAPMVAAELEGTEIDTRKLFSRYAELAARYEAMVVEGIGGLLVPIKQDYFVSDMAASMGLPVLVVGRAGLGTINHVLLTVEAAERRGLNVAGIVLNNCTPPTGGDAEATNPDVISKLSPFPLIGVMPYLDPLDGSTLGAAVEGALDMQLLKRYL